MANTVHCSSCSSGGPGNGLYEKDEKSTWVDNDCPIPFFRSRSCDWVGRVAQGVKELADEPKEVGLISRTHTEKGKSQLYEVDI